MQLSKPILAAWMVAATLCMNAEAATARREVEVLPGQGELIFNESTWLLPTLDFDVATLLSGDELVIDLVFSGGRVSVERSPAAAVLPAMSFGSNLRYVGDNNSVPSGHVAASYEFLGVEGDLIRNPVSFPSEWGPLNVWGDFNVSGAAFVSGTDFSFSGMQLRYWFTGTNAWKVDSLDFTLGAGQGVTLAFAVPEPSSAILLCAGLALLGLRGLKANQRTEPQYKSGSP